MEIRAGKFTTAASNGGTGLRLALWWERVGWPCRIHNNQRQAIGPTTISRMGARSCPIKVVGLR